MPRLKNEHVYEEVIYICIHLYQNAYDYPHLKISTHMRMYECMYICLTSKISTPMRR